MELLPTCFCSQQYILLAYLTRFSSLGSCSGTGENWMARFGTNGHFQNIRIPFSAFRRLDSAIAEAPQQLDPTAIRRLALSFENRSRQSTKSRGNDLAGLSSQADRDFLVELNRVHVGISSFTSFAVCEVQCYCRCQQAQV